MTEQPPQESRSWRNRVRGATRRATEPLTSTTDALTGKGLEREVAEYTDTFTQVVLGLHEDLGAASRRIEQMEQRVAEMSGTPLPSLSSKKVTPAVALGALALTTAVAALGVSLWAAL